MVNKMSARTNKVQEFLAEEGVARDKVAETRKAHLEAKAALRELAATRQVLESFGLISEVEEEVDADE